MWLVQTMQEIRKMKIQKINERKEVKILTNKEYKEVQEEYILRGTTLLDQKC